MKSLARILVAVGILTSISSASAQDVITVGSQTGAQIFFNSTLNRTYNFGVTQTGAQNGLSVSSIDVNVKGSNSPSAPVVVSIYSGLGGTGSVLASGTIPVASLTGQFQFLNVPIQTLVLPAGGYSVRLLTDATENYYIKNGSTKLTTNGTASVTSTYWVEDTNTDGSAGTTLDAAGTVLATWTLGTNAAAFGNYRVGATLSSTTPIVNTALVTSNTVTQALAVSGTTFGGVNSLTGLPSPYLSVGGTANVVAALNGATTGPNSGTASLSFDSVPGTSLTTGTTAVGSGTLALSGTGWNWANAAYSGTAFAFGYIHRGGAAASGTVSIGNQVVTNASYQDSLDVSASTGNPLVGVTGFNGLAASTGGASRGNVVVSIGTGTAGSLVSTVALSLVSNANGVAGLSNGSATVVGTPGAVMTTGTVYTGQSTWNVDGSGQWGTLASNFGTNWNWSAFDGSPGVDAGFADTDTATFGNVLTSGTAVVTITPASAPSIRAMTFDNAVASYRLEAGAGASLTLLNAGTASAAVGVVSGSHSVTSSILLGSGMAANIAAAGRLDVSGVIAGSKGIDKTGDGTLVLLGENVYGGSTAVSAGRLLIHGDQSAATGAITVASGAVLGGRGAAGGAVTVLAGGTLSPGASVESLSVGATTFSGTSTFEYEVDSSVLVGSGTAADLLVTNGNLSIESGSLLTFLDLAASPTAFDDGTKFTLISYGTNSWNGGLFTYQSEELSNRERFWAGLNEWEIRYDDPTGGSNFTADQLAGSHVTITAVPEPSTLVLVGIGGVLAAFVGFRRRK